MNFRNRKGTRAVTLVEVLVAALIGSLASIATIGSIVYAMRSNADNKAHMLALSAAAAQEGLVRAGSYARIGEVSTASTPTAFEYQFRYSKAAPFTLSSDPSLGGKATSFKVWYDYTGFGTVGSATSNTLTAAFPANQSPWKTNEWTGSYVEIVGGMGVGQIARIISNTGTTLSISTDLTGASNTSWQTTPNSGSTYTINNGKTVRINLSWGDAKDFRTLQRTVVIPRT